MPDETNDFDFDNIAPWTVTGIKFNGKNYVLKEPSAGDGHKYRASRMKGGKLIDDGKTVVLGDPGESEILLVSLCVREVVQDGKERAVDIGTVRGWPDRVVAKLAGAILDRSPWLGGVKKGDDRPKTLPGETPDASSDKPGESA